MEVEKKRWTNIQQQRQPGDSLHREDEERDHGKASTFTAAFNLLQGLFESSVAGPDKRRRSVHLVVPPKMPWRIRRYSQQLLQCPLLECLIRAINDVGFKATGRMVLNDVANVSYDWILIVTLFQILKKPKKKFEWAGSGCIFMFIRLKVS